MTDGLTDRLTVRLTNWLKDWHTEQQTNWHTDWLTNWLTDRKTDRQMDVEEIKTNIKMDSHLVRQAGRPTDKPERRDKQIVWFTESWIACSLEAIMWFVPVITKEITDHQEHKYCSFPEVLTFAWSFCCSMV